MNDQHDQSPRTPATDAEKIRQVIKHLEAAIFKCEQRLRVLEAEPGGRRNLSSIDDV